jgi:hypothetical protein
MSTSTADRIAADATRIAAFNEAEGNDAFRMLEAYLWLNRAELQAAEEPSAAAASFARLAEILRSLPPPDELSPPIVAALTDAGSSLIELAGAGRMGDPAIALRLTPFLLGLAEPRGEGTWDAASLRSYATTAEALAELLPEGDIAPDVLTALRFAERRFGHNFRVETEEVRQAAEAALSARLKLINVLLAHDPERADWLAAKGTTEFWIGYRLHEVGTEERTGWLTAAVRDLSAARAIAGDAFPPESRYWLTEARRWLPLEDDAAAYLALAADGRDDYEALGEAFEDGEWDAPPVTLAELFASNTELLARIADAETTLVFDRGDAWDAGDPVIQGQILDALASIAAWDRIREMAIREGSTWTSLSPGFAAAAGYLTAVVGGHQRALDGVGDACDLAASFAGDPQRNAPAVAFADLDPRATGPSCRSLWSANPDDPRINYLLSRLLAETEDRKGLALDALQVAAEADYAAAFNSVAGYLEDLRSASSDAYAMELEARSGYGQRAIKATFEDVFGYLFPLAKTEDHREGLRWLLSRAAALGSAEAHVALAEDPDLSPSDRYYHLEVAALLFEEEGEETRAEEIRSEIPPDEYVEAADRAEDEYRQEGLVGLPAGVFDLLRGPTN